MAQQGILSLSIKDRQALYKSYMPFVSGGGLFVPSTKRFRLGDEVFLLLTVMEFEERLPIPGKVVWVTPHGAAGNRKAGSGVMEITRVTDTAVDLDLTFTRPFKSANRTGFTLHPDGDRTRVTWRMQAPRTLGMRIAGLFMNMDKAIGADFDKGLTNLRGILAAA